MTQRMRWLVGMLAVLVMGIGVAFVATDERSAPVTTSAPTTTLRTSALQPSSSTSVAQLGWPLDRAAERITKKPFGLQVSPTNSPVTPERFSGYHAAVDFEVFPEEMSADVPVQAICDGELLVKRTATGYGGVAVQACTLEGQVVTIVYGHLKLTSIVHQVGAELKQGEPFAILGKGESSETSGERKHLHLGIHRGAGIDIRGYVPRASDLGEWLDLQKLVQEAR